MVVKLDILPNKGLLWTSILYFLVYYTASFVITDPRLPLSLFVADGLAHNIFAWSSEDGRSPAAPKQSRWWVRTVSAYFRAEAENGLTSSVEEEGEDLLPVYPSRALGLGKADWFCMLNCWTTNPGLLSPTEVLSTGCPWGQFSVFWDCAFAFHSPNTCVFQSSLFLPEGTFGWLKAAPRSALVNRQPLKEEEQYSSPWIMLRTKAERKRGRRQAWYRCWMKVCEFSVHCPSLLQTQCTPRPQLRKWCLGSKFYLTVAGGKVGCSRDRGNLDSPFP